METKSKKNDMATKSTAKKSNLTSSAWDSGTEVSEIRIGLNASTRSKVIDQLNLSIANEYVLTVKTKKIHWDVVGPQFRSLHLLLDEHYTALSLIIDQIAERARMLGGHTIGTMTDFVEHAELEETRQVFNHSTEAVHVLVADHEAVLRQVRKSIDVCDDLGDVGTADFLTGVLREHEKISWMLRSFVEGESIHPMGDAKLGWPSNGKSKN